MRRDIRTQREIGLMRRRMIEKYNRILTETELERLINIVKRHKYTYYQQGGEEEEW